MYLNESLLVKNIILINIITFALVFGVFTGIYHQITLIIAFIHLIYAFIIYTTHGKEIITALGAFSIATMFFLALPPIYYSFLFNINLGFYEMIASFFSLLTLIIINQFSSNTSDLRSSINYFIEKVLKLNNKELLKNLFITIIILLLLAFFVSNISIISGFYRHLFYIIITLFFIIFILNLKIEKNLFFLLISFISLVVSILYFLIFLFGGGGRLNVVVLGYMLLIITTYFYSWRILKIIPLLFAPVFLLWGGIVRGGKSLTNIFLLESGGLSSLFSPYFTFVRTLEQFENISTFLMGETYINNLFWLIPRSIWGNKPIALGSIYTRWFSPHLVRVGHSYSPSFMSEIYVNFGYIGIFIMPIILGVIIRYFDINIYNWIAKGNNLLIIILKFIVLVMIVAGLFDFVWADSNTFFQRTGIRLFLLFGIYIFNLLINELRKN